MAAIASSQTPFTIDIGECCRAAAQALVEARLQRRDSDAPDPPASFLARASVLFGRGGQDTGSLASLIDRSTNLSSLKRTGVFAEDIVQSGSDMTYKRLTNAYSVQELVHYGFNWRLFKTLGFDVDDLKTFSPEHFRLLKINAEDIVRDLPLTGADLIQLRMDPHVLRELRFNFNHFIQIGMTREEVGALMSEKDMNMYFRPTRAQMEQLRQPPQVQAEAAQAAQKTRFTPQTRRQQRVLQSGKLNF